MVIAFFNLRLGWVLSGLVVPGYIVPIAILKPVNAIVIVLEAVLAYGIVKLMFDGKRQLLPWSSVFGRDRFFSLVLLSIIIRSVSDGVLLPSLAAHGVASEWWSADVGDALHSFGLIVVSLLANQFWKTGLRRGLFCFGVTTGITFVIVRYGLMEFTNYRLGSMLYMYDDECVSISQSGKAYITLLLTSYVASRLNLYYSWDFNGILLPALLALQLFEPASMLASFVEAWAVLLIGHVILQSRIAEGKTIEGARKIVLFFTISFAYKMLLGHIGQRFFPYVRMADYYGFGYLLPTLLAIKMYDKKSAAKITRTTLQASLAGGVLACSVGFSIAYAGLSDDKTKALKEGAAIAIQPASGLVERLRGDKAMLVGRQTSAPGMEGPAGTRGEEGLLRLVRGGSEEGSGSRTGPEGANSVEAVVDRESGNEYVYARKHAREGLEWLLVVKRGGGDGIMVEVPRAASDWGTVEAGYQLFRQLNGKALYVHESSVAQEVGGISVDVAGGEGNGMRPDGFRARGVVRVMAVTRKEQRAREREPDLQASKSEEDDPSTVVIAGRIPAEIAAIELKELVPGSLVCEWQRGMYDAQDPGRVDLLLSFAARRAARARAITGIRREGPASNVETVRGSPMAAVMASVAEAGRRGENCYSSPTKAELRVLEDDVAVPLIGILNRNGKVAGEEGTAADLEVVAMVARGFGMKAMRFVDSEGKEECIAVGMGEGPKGGRSWGTYIFRISPGAPYVLEVPRVGVDDSLVAYSFMLFQKLRARALLIAGAAPECNFDGSADISSRQNSSSAFQTVHRNIAKRLECEDLLVMEIRRPDNDGERLGAEWDILAVLSTGQAEGGGQASVEQLMSALREGNFELRLGQRERLTSAYGLLGSVQSQYMLRNCASTFGKVWVGDAVRRRLRFSDTGGEATRFLERLGIPTIEKTVKEIVESWDCVIGDGEMVAEVESALFAVVERQDSLPLAGILSKYRGIQCVRMIDGSTGLSYLGMSKHGRQMPVLFCLLSVGRARGCVMRTAVADAVLVNEVRWGRCGYLYWECSSED